jgi:tetratricopeptide (TPR) repeat protein
MINLSNIKKNFLLLFLVLFIFTCKDSYQDFNQKGVESYNKGNLDLALDYYDKAIHNNPTSKTVLLNKIKALYEQNNYDEALISINSTLQAYPDSKEALYYKSIILYKKGKYMDTFFLIKNLLKEDSRTAFLVVLAYTLFNLEDYDNALRISEEIINKNPSTEQAYLIKGTSLYLMDKDHQAIQCFDKGITRLPTNKDLHRYKALTLYYSGQLNQAIETYNQLINLEPDDADSYNELGIAYYSIREYEKAIQYFDKALNHDNQYKPAYINKATLLFNQDYLDEALNTCQRGLKVFPKNSDLLYLSGIINQKFGNYEESLTFFNEYLNYNPDNYNTMYEKSKVLLKLDKIKQARDSYRNAIMSNPRIDN